MRFTRNSRKHRIGRAHAWHVMGAWPATEYPAPEGAPGDRRWLWIGTDDRGLELEVIAVETTDLVLVIHVMPTDLRR